MKHIGILIIILNQFWDFLVVFYFLVFCLNDFHTKSMHYFCGKLKKEPKNNINLASLLAILISMFYNSLIKNSELKGTNY